MALAKTGLGFPVACAENTTTTLYTNPASTTTYIRSILFHNTTVDNSITISLHLIQNNAGSVGTTSDSNKILRITLDGTDTYFMELAFPIVLTAANDSLRVVNLNTTTNDIVTAQLLGDKEA